MKWLFFILLLTNIALFVWIYPQTNEQPEIVSTPGVKSLTLLSEINSEMVKVPVESVVDHAPTQDMPEIGPLKPQLGEEVAIESEQIHAPANEEEDVRTSIVDVPRLDQSKTEMDRMAEVKMDLFSEEFLSTEEIVADIISEPQPVLQCMRIGPLSKREEADKLSLNLLALGLLPDLHSEISNEQEGYWTLVPPQKNRATAVKVVQQLREAGVTDLWRFTSGSLAHAISLGLFRNERRAEIRKRQIEEKGFDVEVRPRYHQKTRYWLGFVISGDSPVTEAKWEGLVKSYPDIEREVVDCQEIATR